MNRNTIPIKAKGKGWMAFRFAPVFFAAAFCFFGPLMAQDLCPNPGFEMGPTAGGWSAFIPPENKDKVCTVAEAPGRNGKGVVLESKDFARYGVSMAFKTDPGKKETYRIRAWVKADGEAQALPGTAGVVVRCLFSDGKGMDTVTLGLTDGRRFSAYGELEKANGALPKEWTRIEISVDSPAGSSGFNLFLMSWRTKGKIFWDDVTIERTASVTGAPVAVAAPNQGAAIQEKILSAYRSGAKEVVVPPGTYTLSAAPGAPGGERWCLKFEHLTNFSIIATNVTFLITDRFAYGIDFFRCDRVAMKGFTLRRETPPFSQGRLEAVEANTVTIRVDKGYPLDLDNGAAFDHIWMNVLEPATKVWKTHLRADTPPKLTKLADDLWQVKTEALSGTGVPVNVGDRVVWRGSVFNDVRIFECRQMRVVDVTVQSGAGFCFGDSGGEGSNVYERCAVQFAPKPAGATETPMLASAADGFHSFDTRFGPTLIGCRFEGTDDDAIAIHGTYGMILEPAEGNRVVVLRIAQTRNKQFCEVGDHIRVYDSSMVFAGEAKVLAREFLEGYQPQFMPDGQMAVFRGRTRVGYVALTLDKPLTVQPGFLVNVPDLSGGGYLIKDCVIHDTYARGMILKASPGLIEGCTIERTARAAIEFNTETGIWSESDFSRNVVVRSNTFKNVSLNRKTGILRHPGALTMFAHKANKYVPNPGGHRNIAILDNCFENCNGVQILVCSAEGVTIQGNRFVSPMREACEFGKDKGVNPGAMIFLHQSSQVVVKGNWLETPGEFVGPRVEATESVTGSSFQDGIRDRR